MSCTDTHNARPSPPMTNLVQPNPAGNGRPMPGMSPRQRHIPVNRIHVPGFPRSWVRAAGLACAFCCCCKTVTGCGFAGVMLY
eukprot:gene21413-biopygen20662